MRDFCSLKQQNIDFLHIIQQLCLLVMFEARRWRNDQVRWNTKYYLSMDSATS